jgi:hypothetical protein
MASDPAVFSLTCSHLYLIYICGPALTIEGKPVVASRLFDRAVDPPDVAKKVASCSGNWPNLHGPLPLLLSVVALGLLLGAGMRVQTDRSARIPVVTWERFAVLLSVVAALAWCSGVILAGHEKTGFVCHRSSFDR